MRITNSQGKIEHIFKIPRHNPRTQEKDYIMIVNKINYNTDPDKNKVSQVYIGINNVQINLKQI